MNVGRVCIIEIELWDPARPQFWVKNSIGKIFIWEIELKNETQPDPNHGEVEHQVEVVYLVRP